MQNEFTYYGSPVLPISSKKELCTVTFPNGEKFEFLGDMNYNEDTDTITVSGKYDGKIIECDVR